MVTTIAAKDVTEGMKFFIEYAPGREASPVVREVIEEEDGSITFDVARFGLLPGYRADEMVSVER